MIMVDLSAIDQLIDFYGDTLLVKYNNDIIELSDLKILLEDTNTSLSIYNYSVNSEGIFDSNFKLIVSVHSLNNFQKDDLTKI